MKNESRLWPLRKVMVSGTGSMTLECGHVRPPAYDIYGIRFPERRRCWACWSEMTEEQKDALRQAARDRREKAKVREVQRWKEYRRAR